jgi:hypothetical protein
MRRTGLFILACVFGGFGGLLGSIVGHAFGHAGVWAGGMLGGVLASVAAARIALWRQWIDRSRLWTTAVGAAVGFLAAAAVAANTLSSPIGPILSTLLIGVGAVIGSMVGKENPLSQQRE